MPLSDLQQLMMLRAGQGGLQAFQQANQGRMSDLGGGFQMYNRPHWSQALGAGLQGAAAGGLQSVHDQRLAGLDEERKRRLLDEAARRERALALELERTRAGTTSRAATTAHGRLKELETLRSSQTLGRARTLASERAAHEAQATTAATAAGLPQSQARTRLLQAQADREDAITTGMQAGRLTPTGRMKKPPRRSALDVEADMGRVRALRAPIGGMETEKDELNSIIAAAKADLTKGMPIDEVLDKVGDALARTGLEFEDSDAGKREKAFYGGHIGHFLAVMYEKALEKNPELTPYEVVAQLINDGVLTLREAQ